jgi:microcystin-dependent protein
MAQPYIGEIRMFAGNFAPAGWMFCEGQLLPISENDSMFIVLGTTYGGDGQNTFALPDFRGRIPIHQNGGNPIGSTGGVEAVTLSTTQIPGHTHAYLATANPGGTTNPNPNLTGNSPNVHVYIQDVTDVNMSAQAIAPAGGSQPHTNFQPYLCLNYIISLFGLFPTP